MDPRTVFAVAVADRWTRSYMSAAATTPVLLQTISNEKKKKEKLIICSGQWSGPRKREREREGETSRGVMDRWCGGQSLTGQSHRIASHAWTWSRLARAACHIVPPNTEYTPTAARRRRQWQCQRRPRSVACHATPRHAEMQMQPSDQYSPSPVPSCIKKTKKKFKMRWNVGCV